MFNIEQLGAFSKSAYKLKKLCKACKTCKLFTKQYLQIGNLPLTFVDKIFQFNF